MTEIRFLSIRTARLQATVEFYRDTLQLPTLAQGAGYALFQVGATQFLLEQAQASEPFYHFAFDIPRNQLCAAADWLEERLELLKKDGQREFIFEDWNATSVYFHDPSGNIVEYICRHNLPSDDSRAFSSDQLLRISEIGWPSANVDQGLCEFSLPTWRDYGPFKALGGETGLVLLVPIGRGWLPTGRAAEQHPCSLVVANQGLLKRYAR